MGKINSILIFLCFCVSGCEDHKEVVTKFPVEVYSDYMEVVIRLPVENRSEYTDSGVRRSLVIGVIPAGTKIQVIDTRYSKDFMFYQVKMDDGRKGYILWSPDKIADF